MLKGLYLTLLIGQGSVPLPAPKELVDSLSSIQVTNSKDRSGFQISFLTGKNSFIVNALLPAGFFDPISTRVVIIATLNGIPNVIMDGFVTNQQLGPSNEPGKSTLTITGEDLSLAMDIIEMILPYPAMPEVAVINLILAKYAFLGIVPLVIPPIIPVVQSPTENWKTQSKMTDRAYIKQIASRCGYLFFVEAGPLPGQSVAYFGPDVSVPIPQPALTINMDGANNVENMNFTLDGLAKKIKMFTIMDPVTKKIPIPIPVPNINAFKPPLGLRPTPPSKIEFSNDTAQSETTEAAQSILGFMMNNSTAVTGSGSLNVLRYQNILRSRMIVGVRGAGITYDGLYYVDSVTHNIKPGEYKQSFTLSRDGVISNTPFVLP
jgi:hypothetical protein